MILFGIFSWFTRLRDRRTRARLKHALAKEANQLREAGPKILSQRAVRDYPATAMRMRMKPILQSLESEDVQQLEQDLQRLAEMRRETSSEWDESIAAAAMGEVLSSLTKHEDNINCLRFAMRLFADFRNKSRALVPEAFLMIEKAAQIGLEDSLSARAYVEYLWAAGDVQGKEIVESDDFKLVHERLRKSCDLSHPDAETLNYIVVKWLGYSWSHLNLMRFQIARNDFAKAVNHWDAVVAKGDVATTPELALEVGQLYQSLGNWNSARTWFDECVRLETEMTPKKSEAEVLQLWVRCMDHEERMFDSISSSSPSGLVSWSNMYAETSALYRRELSVLRDKDATMELKTTSRRMAPTLFKLLLRLDRRCHQPRNVLRTAWQHPDEIDLNGEIPMIDAVRFGTTGKTTQLPAHGKGAFQAARILLARGRAGDALKLIQQLEAEGQETNGYRLLQAEWDIRTGKSSAALDVLNTAIASTGSHVEVAIELRIHACLSTNDVDAARSLLEHPTGLALPYVTREVFAAICAARDKKFDEAWRLFSRLMEEDPRGSYALNAAGWELFAFGQDDLAGECFNRLLAEDDGHRFARAGWLLASGCSADELFDLLREEPYLADLLVPWSNRFEAIGRHDLSSLIVAGCNGVEQELSAA